MAIKEDYQDNIGDSVDKDWLNTVANEVNDLKEGQLDHDLDFNDTQNAKNVKNVNRNEYDNQNSGTAKTVDWNNGDHQKILMTDNCTLTFTDPTTTGIHYFSLEVIQDATGSRTVTLPSNVKTPGGTGFTASTAANAYDILTFRYNSSRDVYDLVASKNFS